MSHKEEEDEGRRGARQGTQEESGLVQVVWRNEEINNIANTNVDKDRKRYVKKTRSLASCIVSSPLRCG